MSFDRIFCVVFDFDVAFDAGRFGATARRGFRVGSFALDFTTSFRAAVLRGEADFFGAFLRRPRGLDNLDLALSAGFAGLSFARSVGLESFVFAPIPVFVSFALARSGSLVTFFLDRTGGLATFAFVRANGLDNFTFARTTGLVDLTNFLVLTFLTFEGPAPLDFVALRAGALDTSERLTINFGRADLPEIARLLAGGVAELRREVGRDRFTPLTVGSLMQSTKLSKKSLKNSEMPRKLREAYHSSPPKSTL